MTPNTPQHRSYSQVHQLRECGEQYRLERIERVPARPGAATVGGSAFHVGSEQVDHLFLAGVTERDEIVHAAVNASIAELDRRVEENREHGWEPTDYKAYGSKPRQTVEWYRETALPNSVAAYVDWRMENPRFALATVPNFGPAIEVPFNYYIGGDLIHGWIDRVFTDTEIGGYYPLDLKSGTRPKTDEQLGLYAAALNKALGWNVEWGYYLYGLKTGTAKLTPPLRVNHWDDEKLGRVYLPATKLIDLGIFIPNPGEACFHCPVSDHCAFAQAVV